MYIVLLRTIVLRDDEVVCDGGDDVEGGGDGDTDGDDEDSDGGVGDDD